MSRFKRTSTSLLVLFFLGISLPAGEPKLQAQQTQDPPAQQPQQPEAQQPPAQQPQQPPTEQPQQTEAQQPQQPEASQPQPQVQQPQQSEIQQAEPPQEPQAQKQKPSQKSEEQEPQKQKSKETAKDKEREKEREKQKAAHLPTVIWRDPGNISALNLVYGAGGKEHAPDPNDTFTFEKEDMEGTSPKFDVKDGHGTKWRVKLGEEPQSETAATRLLWAVGYFVDEDYYLPVLKVQGLPKLRRGQSFVTEDGLVRHVRLERKDKKIKKIENWDWFKNPFVGTKELNGLRVMMSLLNNWDLKDINNSVYAVGGERRYLVSDVGATFGKTGDSIGRSKSNLKGYEESKFVEKVTTKEVDFEMHSRPFILTAFNVPNYHTRTKMQDVTKHIPRADAKWLGQLLGQLSEEQIRDAFRTAGYSSEEVEGYTKEVQKRIAELKAL
jgi:hypothetical protein